MAWQNEFKVRLHMANEIGRFFKLDPNRVERLLTQRTPELRGNDGQLMVLYNKNEKRCVLRNPQLTAAQAKKGSVNTNVNANASEHEFEKLERQSWTNFVLTRYALFDGTDCNVCDQ
ncbi:hypothetical protein RFI_36290 [Reticulomyxa filosa]|uniref:Uncharacterized protein n=1 Tax=Reticulomyxa filosa TaxID=46433 RepID=X6LHQ3_RETFI|nr:hypothetical protein RFI_36290 [Reticulomyxa filosa]|eukprot:ETO01149.1 hypothetical protein RFI_36290 [Reticulomyxa filosa]